MWPCLTDHLADRWMDHLSPYLTARSTDRLLSPHPTASLADNLIPWPYGSLNGLPATLSDCSLGVSYMACRRIRQLARWSTWYLGFMARPTNGLLPCPTACSAYCMWPDPTARLMDHLSLYPTACSAKRFALLPNSSPDGSLGALLYGSSDGPTWCITWQLAWMSHSSDRVRSRIGDFAQQLSRVR